MSEYQVDDLKRIRIKNKGASLTQRIVNALAKEFEQAKVHSYTTDELLTEWEVRGWKSFKSDWIKPKSNGEFNGQYQQPHQTISTVERSLRETAAYSERCEQEVRDLEAQINNEQTLGLINN